MGQATHDEIEQANWRQEEPRDFCRKAAAFAEWQEPDKSRDLRPDL